MTSSRVLDEALLPLKTASTLIEGTFVDIGGRLEGAMEILDRLGGTFTRLQHELESEDLRTATRDMGKVAERISALANTSDDALEALRGIAGMANAIDSRINQMRKAIKAVDVLAVNAKIAAAHISAAGEEFVSFADEIGRALKVAQLNLDNFSQELTQLAGIVRSAVTEQGSLRQRQAEAALTVPRALSQSVETIAARRQQAATTAASIQRKSAEVGRQIGVAVMALQIGDTTRQRIEHIEYAIGIFRNFDRPEGIKQHIPGLAKLSDTEREQLMAAGCQLQDEQLLDTAKELDRQVAQILSALQALASDAREIAMIGREAYGADGNAGGTFMSDLEENVAQANDLLEAVRTTQGDAEAVVQSVLAASTSLAQHMSAIQSLEADIRLMGLNTTLKCGRLGTEGRSLTVIAQELRGCSNITAAEASAILENLEGMTGTAGRLTDQRRQDQMSEIVAIAEMMANSIGKMGSVGKALADALVALSHDSEAVALLLDETVSKINVHHDIGEALRGAAARLSGFSPVPGGMEGEALAARDDMLAALAKVYTMAREREVYGACFGKAGGAMPAAPNEQAQAAEADLADIFF
ncbi:MAG: chemotaxis protein [Rhodospirillaceae bacterium]|nr:MAG: chemotaxis protein [Rhodospirillaceae bacterium]